jgi:hypothetical protein
MAKLFGSSGSHANPIGVVSVVTGVAGGLASAILWIYRLNPESTILGKYSTQVAHGGVLAGQLSTLAVLLGLMAIIGAIVATTGGQGAGGYFIGFVLGLFALSYPVLTWLNVVSGNFEPGFLR